MCGAPERRPGRRRARGATACAKQERGEVLSGRRRARGATLIEVVLFVLIVGIALSAVLGTLALAAGRSGDPIVQRQALAIAESLLHEILAQPFAATDPDGGAEAIGPEPGEARGSPSLPFDHANDYHGYAAAGIVDAGGSAVAGLAGYSVQVSVQPQALDNIGAGDGLLVRVTVSPPAGAPLVLTGFRAR